MSALKGSSLKNPWTLDGLGKIVPWNSLKDKENRQGDRGRRLIIYKGPPSTIHVGGRAPASGLVCAEPAIREACNQANLTPKAKVKVKVKSAKSTARHKANTSHVVDPNLTPPRRFNAANNQPTTSAAKTCVRSHASGPSIAETGRCDEREDPLTKEDLWETAARPPPLSGLGVKEYHKCGICFAVKSHPVSYECGHSDCYVCIRVLLEHQWTCPQPDCQKVMNRPLTQQFAEEASISHDYPQWPVARLTSAAIPGASPCPLAMSQSQSHKCKTNRPTLTVGATVSVVVLHSADDRRQRAWMGTVGEDTGPSTGPAPRGRYWGEDHATSQAQDDPAFTYSLGNQSLSPLPDDAVDDGIQIVLPPPPCPNRKCTAFAEYRCVDQACVGEAMHCAECIVANHAQLPMHFVEWWNGTHWEQKRTGLRDLGLRIQVGPHAVGQICPFKSAASNDFVLYDLSGVHEIAVDYCGCPTVDNGPPIPKRIQLLRVCWWPATVRDPNTCATFAVMRLFQLINCFGKLSTYDFLRGLEKCTNNDGLDKPPDRRKPYMHIIRQWCQVKRLKRAKRGHRWGGAKATQQGELALKCRACPRPGWNLPEGWENAPPEYRFLYFLFLVMDANFRLSNRNVLSEVADPIFGDGWGYFCKREGDDGYKAHVRKHASDKEISNCSGFQAMFMANTRRVKGLRTMGIGGVTCSRHNMWCTNGMGDLQMGERYCNMDFLLLLTLMTFQLLCLVASYDIACQFAINFWQRMSELPEPMRLKLAPGNVWWKVPNFHLPVHKPPCHSPYSFHWMWGAGMTHGEGVEQNWSASNGAAGSTRLMGPGSRHATLEDIFGYHNYDCLLAMHCVLPKRLAESMKEGLKHNTAFNVFRAGLEELRPVEVAEWRDWVARWEAKQHNNSSESPFNLAEEGRTLRDIQLQIAQEEFFCTDDGVEVEQEHSPGMFISMGLSIEEQQRRLEIDVKALKDPSANQKLGFMKRRMALLKRISKFRAIQRIYMPAMRAVLSDEQKQVFDGNGEQVPEATRLFMPSEIASADIRGRACNWPSQHRGTDAGGRGGGSAGRCAAWTADKNDDEPGILRLINIKIHMAKLRYCYVRAALMVLRGHGTWEERLRVLDDDDVRALNERALSAEEKAQNEHWAELGGTIIEGGVAQAATLAAGEGSHTLSWIWYTVGVMADENDPRLHDALRVEWCKAYSHARRYNKDVRHLREEMRCTIVSGHSEAAEWDAFAREELPDASPELTEGRRAYAAEHARTERKTCMMLQTKWAAILARADQYLAGDAVEGAGADGVTLILELGDELDPEEDEARLEAEVEEGPDAVAL
ncbi:hypothetical protein FB451DRAFT_1399051 [Mycena latifolia]|nr:hypothetical protein FB451DRAFT_1399051 [Mycena latifolia]